MQKHVHIMECVLSEMKVYYWTCSFTCFLIFFLTVTFSILIVFYKIVCVSGSKEGLQQLHSHPGQLSLVVSMLTPFSPLCGYTTEWRKALVD